MAKIAYVTSGKIGIHSFTYNEVNELLKASNDVILCLTQLNKGPYMPEPDWKTLILSKKKIGASLLKVLIKRFKLLCILFREAIEFQATPYFFGSIYFYDKLKSTGVTSIHCQMGDHKLYLGYFLHKLLGKPLTTTIHAHELYKKEIYYDPRRIKKLFDSCSKIITISKFNYNVLVNDIGIDSEKIEVMRLFPDLDRVNIYKEKKKILIVASWTEKKGFTVLIDAISRINRDDFAVWVVGGSANSENSINLPELVAKYRVQDKVFLWGRKSGVMLDVIFSECNIFCLPSITEYYEDGNPREREGIPVSLMEAMAWGKPVISTRHAGIPELVREVLVEEGNVDDLRNAIEFLLNHPEKWEEMGRKNLEIIRTNYTKKNVQKLITIFQKISLNG